MRISQQKQFFLQMDNAKLTIQKSPQNFSQQKVHKRISSFENFCERFGR
jgi:hypothetical protein